MLSLHRIALFGLVISRDASVIARVLSYELTLEERAGDSVGIGIVYRSDDPVSAGNADDARSRHILTAGSSPDYVQRDLTLCVAEENDKTTILINLRSAEAERIRFSSRLLTLATLIR